MQKNLKESSPMQRKSNLIQFKSQAKNLAKNSCKIDTIAINDDSLVTVCQKIDKALIKYGCYFDPSSQKVFNISLVSDPNNKKISYKRLQEVTLAVVRSCIQNYLDVCNFYTPKTKTGKPTSQAFLIKFPDDLLEKYLGWWLKHKDGIQTSIPLIYEFVDCPTFFSDGTAITEDCYNSEDKILAVLNLDRTLNFNSNASEDDAKKILEDLIDDLCCDINFYGKEKDGNHRPEYYIYTGAFLSALMSPLVRSSVDHLPFFFVTAPEAGSGKSEIMKCCVSLAGYVPNPVIYNKNEEEFRKTLASALLDNPNIVSIDNANNAVIQHDFLNQALSNDILSDRILGVSQNVRLKNCHVLFIGNGNNSSVSSDMIRRSILIKLNSDNTLNKERKRASLVNYVKSNRLEIIGKLLTVLKTYHNLGMPKNESLARFNTTSFPEWINIIAGAITYFLGDEYNPLLTQDICRESDPSLDVLNQLLELWQVVFQDRPVSVKALLKLQDKHLLKPDQSDPECDLYELIYNAITSNKRKEVNSLTVGQFLKKHCDRFNSSKSLKLVYFRDITSNCNFYKLETI